MREHQLTDGERALWLTITAVPLQEAARIGAPVITTKIDREAVTPDDLADILRVSVERLEAGEEAEADAADA